MEFCVIVSTGDTIVAAALEIECDDMQFDGLKHRLSFYL